MEKKPKTKTKTKTIQSIILPPKSPAHECLRQSKALFFMFLLFNDESFLTSMEERAFCIGKYK